MIAGKRVIAVIPARGGSRAIPKKSIVTLGGMSILERAVLVAKEVAEIDRIIVSTDSKEIASIALKSGAEVYSRPSYLATDTALVIDALRDLIKRLHIEGETARYLVVLESTAPFRSTNDVRECLLKLTEGADSVATFTEAATRPAKAWRIEDGRPSPYLDGEDPWAPRQLTPQAWELNGAVYAFDVQALPPEGNSLLFGNAGAVLMPRDRSLDINSEFDLQFAEFTLRRFRDAEST